MRIIAFSGLTWWAQLCPLITVAWRPLKTQTLKYLIKQREDRDYLWETDRSVPLSDSFGQVTAASVQRQKRTNYETIRWVTSTDWLTGYVRKHKTMKVFFPLSYIPAVRLSCLLNEYIIFVLLSHNKINGCRSIMIKTSHTILLSSLP